VDDIFPFRGSVLASAQFLTRRLRNAAIPSRLVCMDSIKQVVLVSPLPVDAYPPVQAQATILARHGYRVYLLTGFRAGARGISYSNPGVFVEGFATQATSAIVRRAALAALVYRLVHLTRQGTALEIDFDPVGVVAGLWARRLARRRPCIVVHHHHEILFPDYTSRFVRQARLALGEAELVVVADEGRETQMEQAAPPARRVITVRNAPLASAALPAEPCRRDDFSVVYFGAMGRTQALDSVVRSMTAWPRGTRLHLYGEAKPIQRAELEGLAREVGVADRLVFEGWVPAEHLIETVSRHHLALTLLRPLNENWRYSSGASNKRFQAMAAGLPQISDDGIGVCELVEGNRVGMCVSPDDPAAIGAAVSAYAADPIRVKEEGARGRTLIAERLNYEFEFAKVVAFAFGNGTMCQSDEANA
jgi:glycosyltransferase involved in cell wall biosynthesis